MSQSADSTQSLSLTERQRIEASLAHERELLQSLMDSMPDTIYFKDRQSRFVKVNQAFLQRHGLAAADAVGKTDFDIFGQEHSQQAFADEQRLMATGEAVIGKEEKEDHRDGRMTWVSSTKVPLRDSAGNITGLVGISRDITERKQAEEALRQSEEKFRTIFEQSPIGVELYDAHGAQLQANPASLAMFGLSDVAAVRGFNLFAGTTLTDEAKARLRRGETIAYHATFNFDKIKWLNQYHTTKTGKADLAYLITPLSGGKNSILGYLLQVQDISERKQAEAERERLIAELQKALAEVQTLSGIIPICAGCKKIRDDQGFWSQVESYVSRHSKAIFSHSLCPECVKKYYPDLDIKS